MRCVTPLRCLALALFCCRCRCCCLAQLKVKYGRLIESLEEQEREASKQTCVLCHVCGWIDGGGVRAPTARRLEGVSLSSASDSDSRKSCSNTARASDTRPGRYDGREELEDQVDRLKEQLTTQRVLLQQTDMKLQARE